MTLRIARIYYPVKTLGPGERIGIWTAGCNRRCPGCVSPELQSVGAGQAMTTPEIMDVLASIGHIPDGITISGGEPLLDVGALCELLEALVTLSDDILVYTGYTLRELLERGDERIKRILALCAALVDGAYVDSLNDGIGLRGSSNQGLHVFKHEERYRDFATCPREVQTVFCGNKVFAIGIPGLVAQ